MGNEESGRSTGSIIFAFFIGGLVGAGVALLLAPQPGKETRQKIKELVDEAGSFAADRSDYYYLEDVPWTMYYDNARALHGAYWRTAFGFPQSHGRVNLNPADAHWLYNWANEGDWVYVWDPSGKTPTDPKFYGEGGA